MGWSLFLRMMNSKKVLSYVPELPRLIHQFEQSPAAALAKSLKSWLEPIVRKRRVTKSNGIAEGFQTQKKMISRRACGFRNFQKYRTSVLVHCELDGVTGRV